MRALRVAEIADSGQTYGGHAYHDCLDVAAQDAVAFLLQYGTFRMLFTGDSGVAAEHRFLGEGVDLHATALKVGHHGSAYSSSSEFIRAVHPRWAIISVGRHNLFGHPAPSTIETLKRGGAIVYRTDENGAVSLATNGTALATFSQLP